MIPLLVAGLVTLAAAAPSPAPAPSPTPEPATAARGTLTRPPSLKRFVEAPYPPDLAAAGVTGTVELSVVIDAAGAVTQVQLVGSSGHGELDAAALHAVAQFEFEPAEIDGKPAAVEITYRYEFVLRAVAPPPPAEAPVVLLGRVLERGTRSPVAHAAIEVGGVAGETDAAGRFALRGVPAGKAAVRIVSPEHQPFSAEETIEPGKRKEVEYRLTRRHYDPYEAVVRGTRDRKEVSVHTLDTEEVRTLPGTQGDTLKVLQDLPGVARVPFGLGLLVVRGSAPQDTKVYLDGVEIPLLFHFGGLTSVVNSDAIGGLDFYPGNFGVRYGRATGGSVDVRTRDGRREWHGSAQVDVFDGSAVVEAPLGDGSVLVAARRSWVDGVLAVVLPHVAPKTASELRVAPRYYDYALKVSQPALGGSLSVMAYGANDTLDFVRPEDAASRPSFYLNTGFHRLALRHQRPLGPALANDLTAAFGKDSFDVLQGDNFGVLSGITSLTLRDALTWRAAPDLSLEAGVDAVLRWFRYSIYAPPAQAPGQVGNPFPTDVPSRLGEAASGSWLAPAAWLEADWRPAPRLRLVPGLRLDHDSRLHSGRLWLDPRLAAFLEVARGTTLLASAGLYGEPPAPQQLTRSFGNPDLGVQRALQYSLGVRQDLPLDAGLELTAFYKDLRSVVGATRATTPAGELLLLSNGTVGAAYGLELLLRRQLSRGLFGWLAYTWSRSLRRDDPTMPSYPVWHLFVLDQTHILTLVLSYRTAGNWTFGTRLRAVSGDPYTPCVGSILDADAGRYRCIPAQRTFSARLPGFFQADVRVDKRWVYDRWSLALYLDLQNVTNRGNPEFVFQNYDYTASVPVNGLPIFPTLGLRAEW